MTAAQLRSPLSKSTKSVLRKYGNASAFYTVLKHLHELAGVAGHRIVQGLPDAWRPQRQPLGIVFFYNRLGMEVAENSPARRTGSPDFKLALIDDIAGLVNIQQVDTFCASLFRRHNNA